MSLSNYFDNSGGSGGSETIQQVLNNGNTADRSKPLIFNDGSGSTTTQSPSGINTVGNIGNIQVEFSAAQIALFRNNGLAAFLRLIDFDTISNGVTESGNNTSLYLKGDGNAGDCLIICEDSAAVNSIQQIFNNNTPPTTVTVYNWRDLGGSYDVATTTETLAIGNTVAASIVNTVLFVEGSKKLSCTSVLGYDELTGLFTAPHLGGSSNVPNIAAGGGAGTGPTINISGDDMGGTITLLAGTSPATIAIVATITFAIAYASSPKCVQLTPANDAASALTGTANVWADIGHVSNTQFDIRVGATGLAAGRTYQWCYFVKQ